MPGGMPSMPGGTALSGMTPEELLKLLRMSMGGGSMPAPNVTGIGSEGADQITATQAPSASNEIGAATSLPPMMGKEKLPPADDYNPIYG